MVIGGFQKLTLLDYPGQTACLIFTAGCNFACPYCHNSALLTGQVPEQKQMEEELSAYLKKRQKILDGVVISGGEPLLHKDLGEMIRKIRQLGYKIKLDTNGSFPDRLQELIAEKLLDYVAMDIKTIPAEYEKLIMAAGSMPWKKAEQSMEILAESSVSYEFRTTLVRGMHTSDDVRQIASLIGNKAPYYLQSYVDSGAVLHPEGLSSFTPGELKEMLLAAKEYCPDAVLRNE